MEKNENIYRSRKKMMLENFLGGISWSLGVWIGTTFIIAILVFLLSKVDFIPVIGDFVGQVMSHATKVNSPFNF
jgi:hypothetical protein